ncbi:polymorphic toxin-type HINT domain-containing protein [Lysinibacillus sp. NPDC092081]|uniref:polymorphic toxin-type HINT domain-containing protein n=1 Tax=Lysinibacillus sp. NPDC092081 TaxID=3364131 RepID=UPI0037F71997
MGFEGKDPWGNLLSAEPADSRIKGQPIRYAGYVYDAETKLYYLQARYYDPATARFISRDPDPGDEDDPVTMNGYTYGDDNPVMKTDPDGKWVWLVINAGFAIYDGYKAYKSGKNKKQIAWAVASNFFPLGKVKRVFRAVKTAKVGKGMSKVCHCFIAGTKVLTDEGEKKIEDIEVGDMVLAKDDETGEMAYKEVEWLFQRDVEETYNITVGSEVITTTDEHPFWIVGKGWVETKNLVVGDVLTTSKGKELTIKNIEVKKEHDTVYNFRVKDFHTYFVSNLGIWTHDSCGFSGNGFKNYSAKEIEKKFGLKKGGFHQVKQDIVKDLTNKNSPYKNFMKKVGNNPDIHLSSNGTIRVMSRNGKTSFDTNWNIKDFLP